LNLSDVGVVLSIRWDDVADRVALAGKQVCFEQDGTSAASRTKQRTADQPALDD